MCLLHVLLTESAAFDLTVSAVHCEHGIRGEESLRDAEFAKNFCKERNVPLFVFSADIPARARLSGRGLEEEGREFRYACFREVIESGKADYVATAHHRDDYAETVLFRLARGTSLSGLAAIGEYGGIIRPFLEVTRAEIERFAAENALPFVTDGTNTDTAYARNAIRYNVLPALNDAVQEASAHLVEFALRAEEDDDYLQSLAERELVREGGEIRISVRLPQPLFSRACVIAIKELGCVKDYTSVNLRAVATLKSLQSGRRACLPDSLEAVREGEYITLWRPKKSVADPVLFAEGEISFGGYVVSVTTEEARGLRADRDFFPAGCVVRTRREGDRFTPFGGKEKSLKAFLTDKKIPARVGRELPLIAKENRIYAVLGVEISDEVRVTERTVKTVFLAARKK